MNRWVPISLLVLVSACNRSITEAGPPEQYIASENSVGFDLQPVNHATSQWIATYTSQGKTAKFRIELGPEKGSTSTEAKQLNLSYGEGRLIPEPGSDSTVFLNDLRKALEAKTEVKPVVPKTAVTFTFVNLGDSSSQTDGGGYASTPRGNWTVLKLFFGGDEQESEVFLNINRRIRKAQFSIKDPDYGDLILKEFAKVL